MNDASNATIWRGMNRAQLDAAYDNTSAAPDAGVRRDRWIARSAEFLALHPELLDLRLETEPRRGRGSGQ